MLFRNTPAKFPLILRKKRNCDCQKSIPHSTPPAEPNEKNFCFTPQGVSVFKVYISDVGHQAEALSIQRDSVFSVTQGHTQDFRRGGGGGGGCRGGGGARSAKEANNPNKRAAELTPRTCAHQGSMFRPIVFVLLKVQSLQLSFRPAGVSLGGGGGGQGPLRPPPLGTPL